MGYVSRAYLDQYRRGHTALGTHPQTGDTLFLPAVDRFSGLYVLGVQGMGKSGLLEHLIYEDAERGNAVIVIDPHGDLTRNCLSRLPQSCVARTFVLDMEDEDFPFGVNVFAHARLDSSRALTQAVERIVHIFDVLWPEVMTQQNLPRYVRMATMVLLANPGATLVDMYKFLLDDDFRSRLLSRVQDETVLEFWRYQYDQLKPDTRLTRVQPLLGRLESLFAGRSLVRNIIGQRRPTINFRKAIEQRQLIFVKLPVKQVTQDARLIGTVIIAQLSAAVFSFADLPEGERPGISLYVDEGQHFTTSDFTELFTEGRKFGAKVTFAHQFRNQLPGFLQDATMTARTKVVFRTTLDDASELSKLFHSPQTTIRPEDIETRSAEYLTRHMGDFEAAPVVHDFVQLYLLPLQGFRRGHRVEISHTGTDVYGEVLNFLGGMQGFSTREAIRVDDPLPFLDRLLHTVMRKGDPALPIDPEILRGFANSGIGFWAKARNCWRDPALQPGFQFPAHLIVQTPDGAVWTRKPESPTEMYYHFLFSLRQLMAYLAQHPIGKVSKGSSNSVAQALSHLPVRHAFVQASDGVWYMRTVDTPPSVDAENLKARLHFIREQTRQTYCHPRSEVEAKPVPIDPDEQPTLVVRENAIPGRSRWEDD